MSTLSQALLWFHEGCREIDGAMAVVKFAASMDALSCGRRARGIRSLISCQLKIDDNFEITPDGLTLKQALEQIYSEGRSRTLHGTNEKFAHDWTGIRDIAEQLARLCLVNCIDWTAANRDIDDPSMLSQRNGRETN
ncbi:hypothetical protein AB8B02_22460 [Tardiphaga sp. 862_B3_N4_1]|uniref:hypothetical protein n=1 Tax=Tardiphaga sp. 862_B3_N4_1 TaxID=3240764 RepID=UPI003F26C3EA